MFNGNKYDLIIVDECMSSKDIEALLEYFSGDIAITASKLKMLEETFEQPNPNHFPNKAVYPINKPWFRQKMKY